MVTALSLNLSALAQNQRVYSIQAGAYAWLEEAQAAQASLAQVCSPVFVRSIEDGSGHTHKVRVGRFTTYAQAWVYKASLPQDLLPQAFLVSSDACDGESSSPLEMPVEEPFDLSELELSDPPEAQSYWEAGGYGPSPFVSTKLLATDPQYMTHDELLAVGLNAPHNEPKGVPALKSFLNQYPDDSKRNRARLHLARVLARGSDPVTAEALLKQIEVSGSPSEQTMAEFFHAHLKLNLHQHEEAYQRFCQIANRHGLPSSLRREAMQRAAATAHAMKHYPRAWLAYEQIAKAADSPDMESQSRMQLAGLAFELAGCSKGSWQEVRQLCREVLDMPKAPHSVHATAALMHLETLYEEGKLKEALAEVQDFCITYYDVRREYYLARVWEGIFLAKLGMPQQAQVTLEQILQAEIAPTEKFAGSEPSARAAVWLAWMAQNRADTQARDTYLQQLKQRFPNSEEAQKAQQMFGR